MRIYFIKLSVATKNSKSKLLQENSNAAKYKNEN